MRYIKWSRVYALAQKEVMHVWRDPFTLAVALLLPMFLVTIFGYAIDLDVRDVPIAVFDYDNTQASRTLLQTMGNSEYFYLKNQDLGEEISKPITSEIAKASLIVPRGFEKDIQKRNNGKVQVLFDGSDNSTVGVVMSYMGGVQSAITKKLVSDYKEPVKIETRFLFNPGLKSPWFVVPGLAVVLMAILSILLTALTVAREWESGSMELLLSTPVKPLEIIFGKLAPYMFLSLLGVFFVYLTARLGFGIPFKGSHVIFMIGTILFVSCNLTIGLLISVVTRRQQIATQLSMLIGLLPSMFLSGFVFSIENMTPFWQKFTSIFAAKWYMIICRSSFLRNAGFEDLVLPLIALLLMNFFFIFIATKKFKGNLEK